MPKKTTYRDETAAAAENNDYDDNNNDDSDDISKTIRVTSTPNGSNETRLSDNFDNMTVDSLNNSGLSNNNSCGEVIGVDEIDLPPGANKHHNNTTTASSHSYDKQHLDERILTLESTVSLLQNEISQLKSLVATFVNDKPNNQLAVETTPAFPKISTPNKNDLHLFESKSIVDVNSDLSIDPITSCPESVFNNNNNNLSYTNNTKKYTKGNTQLPIPRPVATLNRYTNASNSLNYNHVQQNSSSPPASSNFNHSHHSGATYRTTTRRFNNRYNSSTSLQSEEARSNNSSMSPNPPSSPTFSRNNIGRPHNSLLAVSPSSSRLSLSQQQRPSISNYPTIRKSSLASHSISNLSVSSRLNKWSSLSDVNAPVQNNSRMREVYLALEDGAIKMALYNRVITFSVPTTFLDHDYSLEKVNSLPSSRLKLEWVHGYRGRDCRCNLYLLPTGEYIYFVGSVVVLYNVDERIQRHYLGHTEDITSLAVHPNKLVIATGQLGGIERNEKRPLVRIWSSVSLNTLQVIGLNGEFETSIACLAFSRLDGGNLLAVVDETKEHNLSLWDWQQRTSTSTENYGVKPAVKLSESFSGPEKVLVVEFHPIDRYSLISLGKSHIYFWDIEGCTLTKKAGLFDKYDKPKFVLNLAFNDFGDAITGDSNGNIVIWPRGSNRPLRTIYNAHTGGVFTILSLSDGRFLTGGGKDRRIVEWDQEFNRTGIEAELPEHCGGIRILSTGKSSNLIVGTMRNCILQGSLSQNFSIVVQGHSEATTCLAVHPTQDQYLSGGLDHQIHLFDSMSHTVVWSKCVTMPATSASFSPDGNLLIVTSNLGKWCVIDALTHEIIFSCTTEGNQKLTCVKFSPSGDYFCIGASDGRIYVYGLSDNGSSFCRMGVCSAHCSAVKEIDWSKDGMYFQSQTVDLEILFWKASLCRQITNTAIVRDLEWHTHNCTIGFYVFGIWPNTQNGVPINYCDRSNDDKHLLVANDSGCLSLYSWPASYQQCLHHNYFANCNHLNIVKFLPNAKQLVAVASNDCLISEWSLESGSTPSTLNNSHNGFSRR